MCKMQQTNYEILYQLQKYSMINFVILQLLPSSSPFYYTRLYLYYLHLFILFTFIYTIYIYIYYLFTY